MRWDGLCAIPPFAVLAHMSEAIEMALTSVDALRRANSPLANLKSVTPGGKTRRGSVRTSQRPILAIETPPGNFSCVLLHLTSHSLGCEKR